MTLLIGAALVAELAVWIERVDIVPVVVEQLGVGHLGGIVGHLDRFLIAFMVAIGRVRLGAAGIARDRLGDAVDLVEGSLHAPEAAAGEDRGLGLDGRARPADAAAADRERGERKRRPRPRIIHLAIMADLQN